MVWGGRTLDRNRSARGLVCGSISPWGVDGGRCAEEDDVQTMEPFL